MQIAVCLLQCAAVQNTSASWHLVRISNAARASQQLSGALHMAGVPDTHMMPEEHLFWGISYEAQYM